MTHSPSPGVPGHTAGPTGGSRPSRDPELPTGHRPAPAQPSQAARTNGPVQVHTPNTWTRPGPPPAAPPHGTGRQRPRPSPTMRELGAGPPAQPQLASPPHLPKSPRGKHRHSEPWLLPQPLTSSNCYFRSSTTKLRGNGGRQVPEPSKPSLPLGPRRVFPALPTHLPLMQPGPGSWTTPHHARAWPIAS